MDHQNDIKRFVNLLNRSNRFHLLIIIGPPGWGKSYCTEAAINELGIDHCSLGSYATPLHLYNRICENSDKLLLIDDAAGVFDSPKSLAILNAATWKNAGSSGKRVISWGSTTQKALMPQSEFDGKMIILTNDMPKNPASRALVSRALHYRIAIRNESIPSLLSEASTSAEHFEKTDVAKSVVDFLIDKNNGFDYSELSLRTLEIGYELASHDDGWKDTLSKVVAKTKGFKSIIEQIERPNDLIRSLASSYKSLGEQCREFQRITGKSRRTFYYQRGKVIITSKPTTQSQS